LEGRGKIKVCVSKFCATFLDAPESPMFLTLGLLHFIFWFGGIDDELLPFMQQPRTNVHTWYAQFLELKYSIFSCSFGHMICCKNIKD
jgi:hypothetical protein